MKVCSTQYPRLEEATFVPSKHIHPICQSCSLRLVVIDLTKRSTTGLWYLHGWEGWAASLHGDSWRPTDGTPGNATFIIVILLPHIHWSCPNSLSAFSPFLLFFVVFFPRPLTPLFVFNWKWHLVYKAVPVYVFLPQLTEVQTRRYFSCKQFVKLGRSKLVKWVTHHVMLFTF